MKLCKFSSKIPPSMLDYLKGLKKETGIAMWRLIYDAIKSFYPDYKEKK